MGRWARVDLCHWAGGCFQAEGRRRGLRVELGEVLQGEVLAGEGAVLKPWEDR